MNIARDLVISLAVVSRDYYVIAQTITRETVSYL